MPSVIGIDIGGTHIRANLVDEKGQTIGIHKFITGKKRDSKSMVELLAQNIEGLILQKKPSKIIAVGMGVPGIVNPAEGIVYSSPHFPEWHDFPIAQKLSAHISLPVFIDNDAKLIALGESRYGAAQDWNMFLMLTLGTGIGGAIMIDKEIFHGTRGFAAEFGHLNLEQEGLPCGCGSHGCFETLVSSTALIRMLREIADSRLSSDLKILKESTKDNDSEIGQKLSAFARKGDGVALSLYQKMGANLGRGLASLINVMGIEKIVLGGGISQAHDLFLKAAKDELKKRIYAKTYEDIEIRPARLGDEAGILGAGLLAFRKAKPL